jgi:transcriptional regulator with XRE-family HTH domain
MSPDVQKSINAHVARRIHARRIEVGLTQQQVARLIGISFQQLQKYEHGTNRISAGRLYQLANVLDTSITYFFAGYEQDASEPVKAPNDFSNSMESVRLIRQFNAIPSDSIKRSIYGLIRALGATETV